MSPQRDTVFLISRTPVELIMLALMGFVGVVMGLAMTFWPPRYSFGDGRDAVLRFIGPAILLISTAVFCACLFFTFRQFDRFDKYVNGRYQIIYGCLQGFSPSTSAGHTPDVIKVQGRRFEYSDSIFDGGYHLTEVSGGYVHADTWVKIYLVDNVIARLDVRQHACPTAPAI
jgi:hypothetical protein